MKDSDRSRRLTRGSRAKSLMSFSRSAIRGFVVWKDVPPRMLVLNFSMSASQE